MPENVYKIGVEQSRSWSSVRFKTFVALLGKAAVIVSFTWCWIVCTFDPLLDFFAWGNASAKMRMGGDQSEHRASQIGGNPQYHSRSNVLHGMFIG